MDQILFDLDNDKVTGLVFVNYKKAFDLIETTCCYQTLSWQALKTIFCRYLLITWEVRKQYVNVDGSHSSTRDITLGVPPGSSTVSCIRKWPPLDTTEHRSRHICRWSCDELFHWLQSELTKTLRCHNWSQTLFWWPLTISTNSVKSSVSELPCWVGLRDFFLWNRVKRTTTSWLSKQ